MPGAAAPARLDRPAADAPADAQIAWRDALARAWQIFGLEQTAALGRANDEKRTAIAIVSSCEARDAEAVKRARPKFLGLF